MNSTYPEAIVAARLVLDGTLLPAWLKQWGPPPHYSPIEPFDTFYRPERDQECWEGETPWTWLVESESVAQEHALDGCGSTEVTRQARNEAVVAATAEALGHLKAVCYEHPFGNDRLRSRLAVAVRQELAELLSEWDALGGEQ